MGLVKRDVSSGSDETSDLDVKVDDPLVEGWMASFESVVNPFMVLTEFVVSMREDEGASLEESVPNIFPVTLRPDFVRWFRVLDDEVKSLRDVPGCLVRSGERESMAVDFVEVGCMAFNNCEPF